MTAASGAEAVHLRRRLLFPLIVLLLLFAATFAGLALFAGQRLNSLAHAQAARLVENVIAEVLAEDRRTARDYAYWDQMVERVFRRYDPAWAASNVGWLTGEFGIRAALVLDAGDRVLHREGADIGPADLGAPLRALLGEARIPREGRPVAAAAFVWRGRELELVTVCALGADEGADDLAAQPGPVLVTVRAIDAAFLAQVAKGAGIAAPHLGMVPAAIGGSTALAGADGQTAAWLHWTPPRPAREALRPLALPVLATLLLLALVSLAYVLAVRRVTGQVDAALRDLAAANARLRESERIAVAARLRAEEADRAKTMFLGNVSHELRTPLNAVIGFADLILAGGRRPPSEERKREYIADIRESGHHLLALINTLIDLSGIEADHRAIDLAPQSLAPVLAAVLRRLEPLARTRDVMLSCAAPPDLAVLSEPLALDQIIANIVGNAVKFTATGSAVEVVAEARADGVAIAVLDRGPGLDPELRDRVFEPFVRGGGADVRAAEGSGLGLTIVQALVRRHDGRIELAERPGGGLAATVVLPRAP